MYIVVKNAILFDQFSLKIRFFSRELSNTHSENSEFGRLSYFIQSFVWFHIVCDRYASDHAHFTFFNLIWPLSLSWVFEIQTNGYTEKLSYSASNYLGWAGSKIIWYHSGSNLLFVQELDRIGVTDPTVRGFFGLWCW